MGIEKSFSELSTGSKMIKNIPVHRFQGRPTGISDSLIPVWCHGAVLFLGWTEQYVDGQ